MVANTNTLLIVPTSTGERSGLATLNQMPNYILKRA